MQAVRMTFENWQEALRITALSVLIGFLLFVFAPDPQAGPIGAGEWLAYIAMTVLSLAFGVVMAIGWHRFVLLGERGSGIVPLVRRSRFFAYVLKSILIAAVILVPGLLIVAVAVALALASGTSALVVLVGFVATIVGLIVSYRLAAVLPAAALDSNISIRQAWEATDGSTGPIVVMALLSALAVFGLDLVTLVLITLPGGEILALVWAAIANWIKAVVGVTIITIIYGHYVEERPLT